MSRAGVNEISPYLQALKATWIEVGDIESALDFFLHAMEYDLLDQGEQASEFSELFGHEESRPWALLSGPGETTGQVVIVSGQARAKSTGFPRGWDSIEVVTSELDEAARRIKAFPGVVEVIAPFNADFSEQNSNVHRSACWLMPWGNHVMLTQAVSQPDGRDFPHTSASVGRTFEMHLRTTEYERGRHLLLDILQMPRLMDVELTSGPFHVGWGLSDDHLIQMVFCKSGGLGTGGGAIELQGHPEEKLHPSTGITRGSTPGGTALVTFTCNELDEVHSRITADGGFECTEIHTLDTGPFASKRSFIIWTVEGAPLELVEA